MLRGTWRKWINGIARAPLRVWQSALNIEHIFGVLFLSMFAFVSAFFAMKLLAQAIPSADPLGIALIIFLVSSIVSHLVARLYCVKKDPGYERFWKAVDYPWVLAATGSIIINLGKYNSEQDLLRIDNASFVSAAAGRQIDSYCVQAFEFFIADSLPADQKEMAKRALMQCREFKTRLLASDYLAFPGETEVVSFARMINLPTFADPALRKRPPWQVARCRTELSKVTGDRQEVLRRLGNSRARDMQQTAIRSAWVGSVEAKIVEEQQVLCRAVLDIDEAAQHRERQSFGKNFFSPITGNLAAWYLTLALFAGIRLGKTAYETR